MSESSSIHKMEDDDNPLKMVRFFRRPTVHVNNQKGHLLTRRSNPGFLTSRMTMPFNDDAGQPFNDDAGQPFNDDAGQPFNDNAGQPFNDDAGLWMRFLSSHDRFF